MPPPTIKEGSEKKASNRGKKRKSDAAGADGEEDCVEVTSIRKQPKNIQSFFGSKPSITGKKSISSAGNKKVGSASASDRDESADSAASQVEAQEAAEEEEEATQEQEQEVPPMDGDTTSNESIEAEAVTPAEMEEASPAKEVSGLSKLAAFKFSASKNASTDPVSEGEEQEDVAA